MNLASLWSLPVLFVVENNGIAQTTPIAAGVAGDLIARGKAFGLESRRLNDTAEDFLECAEAIVGAVRTSGRPHFLVIDTARLGAHSKGDDLRPREEIDRIKARDPLRALRARLPQSVAETTERDNEAFIRGCSASVLGRSYARASIQDVKTPPKPRLFPSKPAPITFRESLKCSSRAPSCSRPKSHPARGGLARPLWRSFQSHGRILRLLSRARSFHPY